MTRSRTVRTALVTSAFVVGGLLAAPHAGAESAYYSGWEHREDVRSGELDHTVSHQSNGIQLSSFDDRVSVFSLGPDGEWMGGVEFLPPAGQALEAGVTYPVGGPFHEPTATAGQVITYQDGLMCGRTSDELSSPSWSPAVPTVGWFRVEQIARVGGEVTTFAATYEVNCQYLDGPLGFEGSVAYRASQPVAAIPAAPATPGPVTGLKVRNTDPDGGGNNTTTLSWTNPDAYQDVTVDMAQLCCDSVVPPLLGGSNTRQWRGRASSYHDGHVEFMDGRIYRVVTRGATGRVSAPAQVTVMGSRLDVPRQRRIVQIGQQVTFSGRLTKSSDLATEDAMSGPPLAGRTLVLCQQYVAGLVDGDCTEVDRATSGPDGRFTLTTSPLANSWYSVKLPSSNDLIGNWAYQLSTGVSPQTDLRLLRADSQRADRASAARGKVIRFTTSRARRGSRGVVLLQRLTSGKWRTVATRRLGTRTDRLVIPFREYRHGLISYRIVKLADSRHVNGRSRVQNVRVR